MLQTNMNCRNLSYYCTTAHLFLFLLETGVHEGVKNTLKGIEFLAAIELQTGEVSAGDQEKSKAFSAE